MWLKGRKYRGRSDMKNWKQSSTNLSSHFPPPWPTQPVVQIPSPNPIFPHTSSPTFKSKSIVSALTMRNESSSTKSKCSVCERTSICSRTTWMCCGSRTRSCSKRSSTRATRMSSPTLRSSSCSRDSRKITSDSPMKSKGCKKRMGVCNSIWEWAGRLCNSRVGSFTVCKRLWRI